MRLPPPEPRREREPIGPLVDIVFLLLVFFLLEGTLEPSHPIEVTPPESEHADPTNAVSPLLVLLDSQGRIGYDGEILDADGLTDTLRSQANWNPSRTVQVEADGSASAGLVLQLIMQLRALGVEEIQLITWPRPTFSISAPEPKVTTIPSPRLPIFPGEVTDMGSN